MLHRRQGELIDNKLPFRQLMGRNNWKHLEELMHNANFYRIEVWCIAYWRRISAVIHRAETMSIPLHKLN